MGSNRLVKGPPMLRVIATLLLLAMAVPLAGCVVEDVGAPGYCARHPYKCR